MNKVEQTKVPLRVTIVNIPLEAWSSERISALASGLGRPLIMDNMTARMCQFGEGRLDYARVLVEFDVMKGYKDKIEIQYRDKNNNVKGSKHVNVEYAWKPDSCTHCKVFGHCFEDCTKREKSAEELERDEKKEEEKKKQNMEELRRRLYFGNGMGNRKFGDRRQNKDGRSYNIGGRMNEVIGSKGDVWKKKEGKEEGNNRQENKDQVNGKKTQNEDVVKTGNKYDALNVLEDDNEELEILKGMMIKELKRVRGEEEGNEDMEDVLEVNSGIAKELNIEEVRGVERRSLWSDLRRMKSSTSGYPWVLMGDFNVTLKIEEHSTRGSRSTKDMQEFVECVNDIEVEGVNQSEFISQPMVLHIPNSVEGRKKAFRFSNFTVDKEEFMEVVIKEWKCDCDGYNMYKLVKKMKNLKNPLKKLAWKNGNLFQHIKNLEGDLKKAQIEVEANPHNVKIKEDMATILQCYSEAVNDEEKLLAQKAKVKWLSEGDKIPEQFVKHFEKFLSNDGKKDQIDAGGLFNKKLSTKEADFMVREVTNKEIQEAMFGIGDDKASGPDGFTAKFFKKSWDIVGKDVCEAIKDFFNTNKLLGEVNATLITLIPKVQHPNKVSEYRPIACCNVIYKCISKIITNRLTGCLDKLISINQSAFVPGRLIQDNLLITHELLKGYNRKSGPPRSALKIDIVKAYDTVNWRFLEQIWKQFGFHEKQIG
ncbi:RNA-directed DNA polymerase, eukaryota, reverse transcriptase zinc-binding domain protein [Tanacetum coccineum]